jgi:parallel beta-helix repeat protein
VDWLSFHQNEQREWMRFGAAIYLEDVKGGMIRGVRAAQGMNALLMTRSDSLVIRDNHFSHNSGLGIGMYRSSDNRIVRNVMDYNVRGYSHGWYRRGQDSAALLMYEQSHGNVVAWNTATHGGDGLFLWAGQQTMDSGAGGANDNLFFHNDFSFAPTNGMEATFSRNRFIGNIVEGNDHGLWGGYSWESVIEGNCFARNRVGIALEHGQDNVIRGNVFAGDTTALYLWANPIEPSDWGYPKHRDTRSRDYAVTDNRFIGNGTVWRVLQTEGLDSARNEVVPPAGPGDPPRRARAAAERCDPRQLLGAHYAALAPALTDVPQRIPVAPWPRRERSAIVVDEWGPYDWQSPKLWPTDTMRDAALLRTLGPAGSWRVVERRGVAAVSAARGRMGDTLTVIPEPGREGDWAVALEYIGGATVSPRGVRTPAGTPVRFRFERFEPAAEWEVRFFTWSDTARDPHRGAGNLEWILARTPVLERRERRLDYQWYRPRLAPLPQERWALDARATLELPAGEYSLRTISDDAVRVWVDGALVIDRTAPGGSELHYAPLSGGQHDVRVAFYQLTGWTELRVDVVRGSGRSAGSAGPH